MFIERYLTPSQIQMLDPTGRGRAHLKGLQDTAPTPMSIYFAHKSRDEWAAEYSVVLAKITNQKHRLYNDFSASFESKYGAQGGRFSLETLKSKVAQYYVEPTAPMTFTDLKKGLSFFLELIDERISYAGIGQWYELPRGVTGTSGGLPTMSKKGSFDAETYAMKSHRHMFPILPGERYMRLKQRPIFIDSCNNVRYIEKQVASVREWMKTNLTYLFNGWFNPFTHISSRVTRALMHRDAVSIETDYDSCDTHFHWAMVKELIMPIYERFLNPVEFIYFYSAVEELFKVPIFWGDSVWEGLHALLSGQVITNDFETYFDIIMSFAAFIKYGVNPFKHVLALLANGDDLSIITKGLTETDAKSLMQCMVELGTSAGEAFSVSKCAIHTGFCTFCKRIYYPGAPRTEDGNIIGAYPAVLTLNSIVNPEFLNTGAAELSAFIQRMDNLYGCPYAEPLIQWLASRAKVKHKYTTQEVSLAAPSDWWSRLYGETWNTNASYALAIMTKSNLREKFFID